MRILRRLAPPMIVFGIAAQVIVHAGPTVEWEDVAPSHPGARAFDPHFTTKLREEFPQCRKGTYNLDPKLVVHVDGTVEVLNFDDAFAASRTGNTWVIASCD